MHELAITQQLLILVNKACEQEGISRVSRIEVELGALTTYKKEPVQYYFGMLTKNAKRFAATTLDIREIPGMIRCLSCNKQAILENPLVVCCPHCQSFKVDLVKGKDFYIKNISGN